jgi:hypothetical protein
VLSKHPVSRLLVVLFKGRETEYLRSASVELSAWSDGAVLKRKELSIFCYFAWSVQFCAVCRAALRGSICELEIGR